MNTPPTPTCASCGAPDDGEFVMCKFCHRPLSSAILQYAIPCPRCSTQCRWGKQRCGACGSWIVVSCIFCGALSPCSQPACLSCHEAFAGAPERKAQREAAARQQQEVQTLGTVGNVAASFLGAMAGGAIGGSWGSPSHYHGHYHPSWDASSGGYDTSSSNDSPPIGTWSDTSGGGDISGGGLTESGGSDDSSSSSSDDS